MICFLVPAHAEDAGIKCGLDDEGEFWRVKGALWGDCGDLPSNCCVGLPVES